MAIRVSRLSEPLVLLHNNSVWFNLLFDENIELWTPVLTNVSHSFCTDLTRELAPFNKANYIVYQVTPSSATAPKYVCLGT